MLDDAVAGTVTLSANADVTLTTTNGAANQARNAVILWTASNGATTRNITAPAQSKAYVVINAGNGSVVIRGAGPTTGVTVTSGTKALVAWNGSDFVKIASTLVNLASEVTGTLPVANGGTGNSSIAATSIFAANTANTLAVVTPTANQSIRINSGGTAWEAYTPATGSGSVTTISVVGANGLAGTVANPTTTPAITLSTSITGVLKGNGTAISAAVAGTDYVTPTGAETLTNKTLTSSVIVLDAVLSADGEYTGVVQAGVAAAALTFGQLCYRVTASGKWNLASGAAAGVNTVVAAGQLGMCVLAAAGDGSVTTILMYGNCRSDALFDTFTVGAALYMSAATAGKIVSTAPTGTTDFTVRKVGFAEDANTVFFNPSNDYITLV